MPWQASTKRAVEKVNSGATGHDEAGWTVRCRNPRDRSSVAVARTEIGSPDTGIEAGAGGGRPQRLAA